MGFFSYVGEMIDDMSKVEQNYRDITTFVKSTEKNVISTRAVVSKKKAAGSYTIPSDMKKQCKMIQEKYEINADLITEEVRKDRKEIDELRRQVKSECQSIADEVRRMEERFGETGGRRL